MSTAAEKLPLSRAGKLAERWRDLLSPACERVQIVGSVRRLKSECGDVELLCVPREGGELFGVPTIGGIVDDLCAAKGFSRELDGPRQKRIVIPGWCKVEIFIVPRDEYGVACVIRTGPSDFSARFVHSVDRRGMLPIGWCVCRNRLWRSCRRDVNGSVVECSDPVETPDEESVFAALRMPYITPEARR